jgi:3-oxoacyl-[acyl-carrier-protein] synthase-3
MHTHEPLGYLTALAAPASAIEHAADAAARGRIDADQVQADGWHRVSVERSLHPPQMALAAAHQLLDPRPEVAAQLDVLFHASTWFQGIEFWSPAHFIATSLGAHHALPIGILQLSNGAAMAIELALGRLAAEPTLRHALVTTAERYSAPHFDRWSADTGIVYGDGATAVLLSRDHGVLALDAMATTAAAELEGLHRGEEPFRAVPDHPVDIGTRRAQFLAAMGPDAFEEEVCRRLGTVLARALAAARRPGGEGITTVVLPRVGRRIVDRLFLPALTDLPSAQVVWLGDQTGHLGAGDFAANLEYLQDPIVLAPGAAALVLSAGAGLTWTVAVVRRP